MAFFFFSSRRRHTRYIGDWSSDVCSSDLVQAEFEGVLDRLMGRRTAATGAGRTDTGVHALGQGVGFLGDGRWAEDVPGLYRALNALLPRDIWVERVSPMRPGFHARNSALARRYRYVIGTDDAARSPFRRPYEWAVG